jgi:hypothetical protein
MHVPPQEVCPFSAQQSFDCPTSLLGLQQHAEHEVSDPCSYSLAPWEINSQQFSHLERILTGLKTHFFNIPRVDNPLFSPIFMLQVSYNSKYFLGTGTSDGNMNGMDDNRVMKVRMLME